MKSKKEVKERSQGKKEGKTESRKSRKSSKERSQGRKEVKERKSWT